jgi:hypothetical protein
MQAPEPVQTFGKEKNLFPLPGTEPQSFSSNTYYTISSAAGNQF